MSTSSAEATASSDPTGGRVDTSGTTGAIEPDTTTSDTDSPPDGDLCGVVGPRIDANLVHGDADPGCGILEFNGQSKGSSGPVYELDGCPCSAQCEAPDPWTLTLDVPSESDLPLGGLPECPRIIVQRTMGKQGCELVGVSIWNDGESPGLDPGWYHAGSLLGPIDAIKKVWKIEAIPVGSCACEDCCDDPTRFDLKFSLGDDSTIVAEGGNGAISTDGGAHPITNFQSHVSGQCDASPEIDWVISFAFIPPLIDDPAVSDITSRP